VARAARMVVSPQPHPMSRTFSPSWICAAASNRAVSRPRIRSHRSRCSTKCLLQGPFHTSACSEFTATKATLHRRNPAWTGARGAVRYVLTGDRDGRGACQNGEFCAQPLV
jgi:hypothetical protein